MPSRYGSRKDLSKYTLKSFDGVDEFCFDTNNGDLLTYDANGTNLVVVDTTSAQTLTNKTLTAPVISSPVVSGAGQMQVAVVNLDGATWHTGNGTADFLSWTVPTDCVIARLVVNTTTKSTGAATTDIGYTATDNHTNADNLIDGADIGTAVLCYSNLNASDTEKREVAAASGKFVTFHALADPTGLVGKAYIFYFTL